MNLAALNLLNMWWEKADGSRLPVNIEDVRDCPPVEEYPFAHVRFPLQVKTEIYRRRADGLYGETDRIAVGESGASATLVLALATGGRRTWRRLWRRHQSFPLGDAMIIASEACERCLNALAYEYGLDWGYPEYSS